MDYKIINPNATELQDQIGISPERCLELSKKLDDMVRNWSPKNGGTVAVKVCDIMEELAFYCNNIEEFSYCVLLHMGWHQRRGMLLSTGR